VTNISQLSAVIAIFREANSNSRFSVLYRQVFSRLSRLVKGKSNKLSYYHEEKAKNEFGLKKLAYTVAVDKTRNMEHSGTFRDIPEHRIIIIIMRKICKIKFLKLK